MAQGKETCPTCKKLATVHGHLCVPMSKKDLKCDWCGSLIPNERHLCNAKVQKLAYICNSCGRTAVSADYLCQPEKINPFDAPRAEARGLLRVDTERHIFTAP